MSNTHPLRILPLLLLSACGLPLRSALIDVEPGEIRPLDGFPEVRAADGYPSPAFQGSFDTAIAQLAATPLPEDGRRDYPMLVLSSGGVNGAFGAGILTGWSRRGDRPEFWLVTGVSVGALMAPFAFAGPEFDDRLETLFRRIAPEDMHEEKGVMSSVLWDESLMDNAPLAESIAEGIDMELLDAVARGHQAGRRLYVGSTNLDTGSFVVWDMGAIASRRSEAALDLFRKVLRASASIPVVYPPVRFPLADRDELHVDGAVVRPLFIPQNVFDGYESAAKAGIRWDDVDATLYVVHNGSLRPCPVEVERDTLAIAMRTVTMMSHTMVSEDVLHLYMLSRAWGAEFQFLTMPDGLELSVESFTPDDTDRLFLLGAGIMEREEAWRTAPPGYVVRDDLNRIAPTAEAPGSSVLGGRDLLEARMESIEKELRLLREALQQVDRREPK